jgi:hypothetical protein
MPSLISCRVPEQLEERSLSFVTNGTSMASITDINQLLEGVTFDESFQSDQSSLAASSFAVETKEAQISVVASNSMAPTPLALERPQNGSQEALEKHTPLHIGEEFSQSLLIDNDPDVTTLDDGNNSSSFLSSPKLCIANGKDNSVLKDTSNANACIENDDLDLDDPSVAALDDDKSRVEDSIRNGQGDGKPGVNDMLLDDATGNEHPVLEPRILRPGSPYTRKKQDALQSNSVEKLPQNDVSFERRVSRHESLFKQRFEQNVVGYIEDFKQRRPNALVDYENLSRERKIAEIQKVQDLLSRTYHHGKSNYVPRSRLDDHDHSSMDSQLQLKNETYHSTSDNVNTSRREATLDDTTITKDADVSTDLKDDSHVQDRSMALLSPSGSNLSSPQTPKRDRTSIARGRRNSRVSQTSPSFYCTDNLDSVHTSSFDFNTEGDSCDSIEQVRRNRKSSNSPMVMTTPLSTARISQKRFASMSGKRGADTSRLKLSSGGSPLSVDQHGFRFSIEDTSPPSLHYGASPRAGILFAASQSPILHDVTVFMATSSPHRDTRDETEELETPRQDVKDSIYTVDMHSGVERRVRWNLGQDDSHLQEIPANVSLKESVNFKMQPLKVRKLGSSKRGKDTDRQHLSFPDPLEKYRGSEARKLAVVKDWIEARDDHSARSTSGIVFSVQLHQITDAVLSVMLKAEDGERQGSQSSGKSLEGATLVICRSKEDTEEFASTFRAGSAFSVLNHAALPLADRTRSNTATRCATFDVVLSTFDAIMSKDVVTTLNGDGHVIRKEDQQDGWFSSRGASNDEDEVGRVEKLSVLHMLDWRRVVFVDDLGRKSYIAKSGTLRAKAAAAINATTRFVFFPPSEARTNQWEALGKSDRRSFESVAAVLRLPQDAGDESIFSNSIDLKNARKG